MSAIIEGLKTRIAQLEEVLGISRNITSRIRAELGLEPIHAEILGMLMKREFVTRDGLYTVLYEGRPECDWPDEKILDVQLCKLRSALRKRGVSIKISTKWGEGWSITAADKAVLRERLERDLPQMVSPRLAFAEQ